MTAPLFNPFAHAFTADPYPHYRRLQEVDPVHRSFMGTWIVSRYEDAVRVLRDDRFSSELRNWTGFEQRYADRPGVSWLLRHSVLNQDPPVHTALRRAIVRAFGPRDQPRLTEVIHEAMREPLDTCRGTGRFDAIADFALPVPVRTVCRVFDIAAEEEQQVKAWSTAVSSLIEPLPSGPALGSADDAVDRFKAYLGERMEAGIGEGLAERVGRGLRHEEVGLEHVLASLVLMFPAGHETTVNLIGNGLLTLLRNPDQLAWLRADPSLWGSAIEEMLRFESPQQVAWRVALEPVQVGERWVAPGEQVLVLLGAANRDPDVFEEPDAFDIGRRPNRHLAFGLGRHACLGGWFARHQGGLALRALVEAFTSLRLDGEPAWYPTLSFHGLESLPVCAS